jgi:hypothetical protein
MRARLDQIAGNDGYRSNTGRRERERERDSVCVRERGVKMAPTTMANAVESWWIVRS